MSTKYTGLTGQVQVPSLTMIAGIKSWTLDVTADTVETTSFDDAGVKAYLGTTLGWSGSFEGYKTGVPLTLGGAVTSIKLVEATGLVGQEWTGACIITGCHVAGVHDGLTTYAYDFQGSGGLTEPTA